MNVLVEEVGTFEVSGTTTYFHHFGANHIVF